MQNILKILISFLLVAAVSSCHHSATTPDEPETPPEIATGKRSVLVYMAARNNLSDNRYINGQYVRPDINNIEQMELAAQRGDLGNNRLLVFHAPRNGQTQLLEITKEGQRELRTYPSDFSTISAASMKQVIEEFKTEAPAENYGLILWSHGTGWIQNGRNETEESSQVKPCSFGLEGTETMNVSTLASVLQDENFDYVYFDCCLMMGVEVMYEMRHCTPTIVGSVTELPILGMPYDMTLTHLIADVPDLEAAAKATFESYDAKTDWERTCTMSVVKTAKLDELAAATRDLYALQPSVPDGFVPQRFFDTNKYYDFSQYIDALAEGDSSDPQLAKEYAARVQNLLNEVITYKANTPYLWPGDLDQIKLDYHCGLSTFILSDPAQAYNENDDTYLKRLANYASLEWYEDVARHLFP